MPRDFNINAADSTVSDTDMPDGMVAQRGMGDIEEEFLEVTKGFEDMHERVPDPMVELEPDQDLNDIQRDAREASQAAVDDIEDPTDGFADGGFTSDGFEDNDNGV